MKYCLNLFQDINFEAKSISPCCNIHGIKIPAFKYHGGPVDIQKYALHLKDTLRRLQTEDKLCKGCPEIKETSHGIEADLLFRTVSINMHRFFCNCKCVYCDLWKRKTETKPYEILEPLQSLYKQGVLAPDCTISWGGGEPSILPEFEKAAQWATEHNFYQLVHTNAIKYSPAIANLLKLNKGSINVSLDSGSAKTYKSVKGVDKFREVTENIEKYSQQSHPACIQLKYIVFEENNRIPDIESFLAFCARLGVPEIYYSLDFREINGNTISEQTILAAAFLNQRAKSRGITATPFSLGKNLTKRIEEAGKQFVS